METGGSRRACARTRSSTIDAPTSRGDVSAYQKIRADLERTAGAINGQHADLDCRIFIGQTGQQEIPLPLRLPDHEILQAVAVDVEMEEEERVSVLFVRVLILIHHHLEMEPQ